MLIPIIDCADGEARSHISLHDWTPPERQFEACFCVSCNNSNLLKKSSTIVKCFTLALLTPCIFALLSAGGFSNFDDRELA